MQRQFQGALLLALSTLATAPIQAAELVYRPVNPAFGGRPLNGAFLLNSAQAQNKHKDPDSRRNDDPAQQFARALQSRLLSAVANQVVEALFGDNPQDDGEIVFGDQTIRFTRGLDTITVEIADAGSGSTTVIEVPIVQLD